MNETLEHKQAIDRERESRLHEREIAYRAAYSAFLEMQVALGESVRLLALRETALDEREAAFEARYAAFEARDAAHESFVQPFISPGAASTCNAVTVYGSTVQNEKEVEEVDQNGFPVSFVRRLDALG